MALRIRIRFNESRILETTIKVEGTAGPSCLVETRKIIEKNPEAVVTDTDEMYLEEARVEEEHLVDSQ